ncbi:MAG TPA: hypothetical protein DCX54_07720 [Flavobacteriales bacterium]|nr:hypothetical protein [Flavobacteriales bacterium]
MEKSTSEHQERLVYVSLTIALGAVYLTVGLLPPLIMDTSARRIQNLIFGLSQLRYLANHITFILAALIFVGVIVYLYKYGLFTRLLQMHNNYLTITARILLSVFAVGIFFLLRNNFLNPDGVDFAEKFARDIPLYGAHVTPDEMWELYLHSRFWFYTNQYLGWSVQTSYQVMSCLAGGVFIFLLLTYSPRLYPESPFIAFMMCISGGYMQLFFGDVENYTLTTTLILAYFLFSALFIEKMASILLPSITLAIAITFHLISGFLAPSLLILWWISWKRGEKKLLPYAGIGFIIPIGLTLFFFHFNGLPINSLWYKSVAYNNGLGIVSMLVKPSLKYYFAMANLIFLLMPTWICLVPLIIYKRIAFDQLNTHLLTAAGGMTILLLGWNAGFGPYRDWNLYATAALPISFLVWRNILQIKALQTKFSPAYILGGISLFHSFVWIIHNHFL